MCWASRATLSVGGRWSVVGGRWSAVGEGGQGRGGCLTVGGPEMEQGLLGGCDLLVVVAEPVPSDGGDDGQESHVQEHRQSTAVTAGWCGPQGADGSAQGSGLVVPGPNPGAGCSFEGRGGLAELRTEIGGATSGRASSASPKAAMWAWAASSSARSRWCGTRSVAAVAWCQGSVLRRVPVGSVGSASVASRRWRIKG
ncbi:hypothetical protein ADK56_02920 [Streptomyces sp. MMG1522]|nr:hypothetical protein ADK56_02920 [Streptomyces sp. MMG1522]